MLWVSDAMDEHLRVLLPPLQPRGHRLHPPNRGIQAPRRPVRCLRSPSGSRKRAPAIHVGSPLWSSPTTDTGRGQTASPPYSIQPRKSTRSPLRAREGVPNLSRGLPPRNPPRGCL